MTDEPLSEAQLLQMHWMDLYLRLPEGGVVERFSDELECEDRLKQIRWPDGPVCPKCEQSNFGYHEARKIYHCRICLTQFSMTSGTLLHRRRLDLLVYFQLAEEFIEIEAARLKFSRPTGHELKDRYSIAYATAFRLRKYLVEDLSRPQGGILGQCICTQEIEMPPDVDRGTAVYLQWLNDEVEIRRSHSRAQFSSIIE